MSSIGVFAPGRVNLIGDHTDYAGGLALPCAIDLGISIDGRRTPGHIDLDSTSLPGAVSFPTDSPPAIDTFEPRWGRHVAAVARELGEPAGLTGSIDSTLPVGAGLSSSAALDVALALALGHSGTPMDLARLAQRAETAAVGVPCGLLDQLSVVFGRAGHGLLTDFHEDEIEPIAFPDDLDIWIVHSGEERRVADSQYAERRASCERAAARIGPLAAASITDVGSLEETLQRRARHVVSECARVREAAGSLAGGDAEHVGRLMTESHASLRDDFDVSTPTLDRLVERLRELPGVHGARLTGAGFGGCVVALCARGAITEPDAVTGRGWLVRPSDGARRIGV